MREDEIYILTKEWFKTKKYKIVAGQPPNGSDNIPVIEIKALHSLDKGSKGSFKPDLVVLNSKNLIIVECKPLYNKEDEKKLEQVLFNSSRVKLLFEELNQRQLIKKTDYYKYYDSFEKFEKKTRFCLSNTSSKKLNNLSNLVITKNVQNTILIDPINLKFKII